MNKIGWRCGLAMVLGVSWLIATPAHAQCAACGSGAGASFTISDEGGNCHAGCDGDACDDGGCGGCVHCGGRLRGLLQGTDQGGDGMHCCRPAPQYPVPVATPKPTVPTHFTYPPLMPHHSLPHYRNIYSYRHNCGMSRTNVHWHPNYPSAAFNFVHHLFELPR